MTARNWFEVFAAIAHKREDWAGVVACACGMVHRCGKHYGFGAEVGRG